MNKKGILNNLYKYHLDPNQYMVISGASMVLQGIKENTKDIDIALSKDYTSYLLNNFDCKLEENKKDIYYIDDILNFGPKYYNRDEVVMINGIPCQNIDGIIKLKKELNRDKDIKDIALIDRHVNINSLALAYLGDAVYEVYIRKYLLDQGISKVKDLQHESIKYVSAKGQAGFLKNMIDDNFLTSDELEIIKRARNHKSRNPKSTDVLTYHYSTGLEALYGYLELTFNKSRIEEITNYILNDKK